MWWARVNRWGVDVTNIFEKWGGWWLGLVATRRMDVMKGWSLVHSVSFMNCGTDLGNHHGQYAAFKVTCMPPSSLFLTYCLLVRLWQVLMLGLNYLVSWASSSNLKGATKIDDLLSSFLCSWFQSLLKSPFTTCDPNWNPWTMKNLRKTNLGERFVPYPLVGQSSITELCRSAKKPGSRDSM